MTLREKFYAFSDKLDARSQEKAFKKYAEKKERVSKKLEKLAESLPEKIKRKLEKNPDEEYLFFNVDKQNIYGEMNELSGYKRLHEACAAENVGVHAFVLSKCITIMVLPQKPYNTSPGAAIRLPKKPVWVQPTLPGF